MFTIGDEVISTADDTTKMVTVRVNGEVVKTMPTSMGKDSTPTANGVYIVGGRFKHIIMDSSTYGVPVNSPNGYRTDVEWATQLSYSGVFVHSAPWSVGAQGHTNTSHGCLNVSPSNAEWFYDHSKSGDIVVDLFGGSGSTMIACEKTGRRANLMELDPKYCDVIVDRWQSFTGKTAQLERPLEVANG